MQNKGIALCKDTGRLVGCQGKHQVPVVQRADNTTIIISIQYMQITELQVSPNSYKLACASWN